MTKRIPWRTLISVVHDGLVGGLLLLWPGLWHELLHAEIERTTFYIPQALGAVLLCRGLFAALFIRRPGLRVHTALGALWAAQVIVCLLLVFRLGLYDQLVATTYVSWALVSALVSVSFVRSSSTDG